MNRSSKLSLLLCFTIWIIRLNAQDYIEYYSLINKAEEEFVTTGNGSCLKSYDLAFAKQTPFLKDPYIASQIALYLGDTSHFYHYLSICFDHHMPLASVTAAPLIRQRMTPQMKQRIESLYTRYFNQKPVDSALYTQVCFWCYQSDSVKLQMAHDEQKQQEFYRIENEARKFIADSILTAGKYLNEHFFPVTSNELANAFYSTYHRPNLYPGIAVTPEYELRVACPFNILLHSYCFFESNKNLLFEAVKKGYLHPKEYGIMEETAILWYKKDSNQGEKCDQPPTHICYNILGPNPTKRVVIYTETEEGLKTVEQNRKNIFMQSYRIDEMKKQLEREYGFAFFFDFIDRQ